MRVKLVIMMRIAGASESTVSRMTSCIAAEKFSRFVRSMFCNGEAMGEVSCCERAEPPAGDDGPGLSGGEEEDVFARFHRGSAGRGGAPGTGLGLPIARELMRAWGGDATLANRPEGGTRATLFAGSFPATAYGERDA